MPAPIEEEPLVRLERWTGPWPDDDPDANFKAEVADYSRLDPMATIRGLSRTTAIPEGALVRYVLARFATTGSGGLLELGPATIHRLWEPIAAAEQAGTDEARLEAYRRLSAMVSWLRVPLQEPSLYPGADAAETRSDR
ncbi:DUF6027 family protein [Pseudonocardia hispaniensis]|uniref:DUF6027 family protein n=1 Tax=Pseudonocardia hispaniensis TaxID=904933 RepID=A0ABW1J2V6_9PSEU